MLKLIDPGVQKIDASLPASEVESIAAAGVFINAAAALAECAYRGQEEAGKVKWGLIAQSGGECTFTLQFVQDRIEVRLGLVVGEAKPTTVFACDLKRATSVDKARAKWAGVVNWSQSK
jgi:hypothetical protein